MISENTSYLYLGLNSNQGVNVFPNNENFLFKNQLTRFKTDVRGARQPSSNTLLVQHILRLYHDIKIDRMGWYPSG